MSLHIRIDGDIAILSNFGRLMNDPRYFDSSKETTALLDQAIQKFIFELAGVTETGSTVLALLTTLTRQIRKEGGEVVLAKVNRAMDNFIKMMQMEDYWDVFGQVDEAIGFFRSATI
jgi:anti-sigma B factor antagonist